MSAPWPGGSATSGPGPGPDVVSASEDYARRFAGAVGAWLLEVQARAVAALVAPLPAGSRLLDVGGGHGQLVPLLLARGFAVTVYGSAPEAVGRAERWVRRGACRFAWGALDALPYGDRAFDAAVCVRLSAHVPEWRRLVAELCRVADRLVVMDYASARSLAIFGAGLGFRLKHRVEGNARPAQALRPRDVAAAFAACGFRVTGARPQFFLPMALHRALCSPRVARWLEAPAGPLGLRAAFGSPVVVRAERADRPPGPGAARR